MPSKWIFEIWNFQFIPPNLNGWQLEVYGRWGDEQDFVADSIKAVGHPGFNFFRGVNIKHPRFKGSYRHFSQTGR